MGQQVLPPGFRFHPTDQELVVHYLRNRVLRGKCDDGVIGDVDLYKFEPWDLPEMSRLKSKDPDWYFFNARDKKYPHGSRTNRATGAGFWKATGKDRKVTSGGRTVGMKKTLVFYKGRAPSGERTDWIMHEYRLDEELEKRMRIVSCFVLCRIQKKNGFEPRHGNEHAADYLDEVNEATFPTENIMSDVANHGLPVLCESEGRESVDAFTRSSTATGFLDMPSHATTDAGPEVIEELSSGEEIESFLQSLLSNESQDANGNCRAGNEVLVGFKQGLVEGHTMAAEPENPSLERQGLNCIEDFLTLERSQPPTTEIPSDVPKDVDLGVHGIDVLHDFLHPAPVEPEILQEIFQSIGVVHGGTVSNMNNVTFQTVADETEPVGDDLFELADMDHSVDEIFWTQPELEMGGTSQYTQRSIDNRETLLEFQAFDNEHGLSPSSEVAILNSGDLKHVSNLKLQCTVNLHKKHNGEGSFTAMSSGFDSDLHPSSLVVQSIRPCIKVNDTSVAGPTLKEAMPVLQQGQLQLLQTESTVTEAFSNDENAAASIKSMPGGQAPDIFQCKAPARMVVSKNVKLGSEFACVSQYSDSKTEGAAPVSSSSQGSPSSASSSLPQIPKFLLNILQLLGDAPILPASAAELSMVHGSIRCPYKGTQPSEYLSKDVCAAGLTGFVSAPVSNCPCKAAVGSVSVPLPCGCACIVTRTAMDRKATPNHLELTKQSEGLPLIQCKCFLHVSSKNKIRTHRESLTQMTPLTGHGGAWKRLFNGLAVFFFWVTTSVLVLLSSSRFLQTNKKCSHNSLTERPSSRVILGFF